MRTLSDTNDWRRMRTGSVVSYAHRCNFASQVGRAIVRGEQVIASCRFCGQVLFLGRRPEFRRVGGAWERSH